MFAYTRVDVWMEFTISMQFLTKGLNFICHSHSYNMILEYSWYVIILLWLVITGWTCSGERWWITGIPWSFVWTKHDKTTKGGAGNRWIMAPMTFPQHNDVEKPSNVNHHGFMAGMKKTIKNWWVVGLWHCYTIPTLDDFFSSFHGSKPMGFPDFAIHPTISRRIWLMPSKGRTYSNDCQRVSGIQNVHIHRLEIWSFYWMVCGFKMCSWLLLERHHSWSYAFCQRPLLDDPFFFVDLRWMVLFAQVVVPQNAEWCFELEPPGLGLGFKTMEQRTCCW